MMKQMLVLSLLICANIFAQKEGNIWYFGENAGLDFNSGVPVPIFEGEINTNEGCATICDKNGQLLFYTDGITVWNKNHAIMFNGTGLLGDPSSSQSGIIVPQPGNDSIYYIFTVAELGEPNGLRYSIVNIKKQANTGEVISKNNLLMTPSTEKITAVLHKNKIDVWVIAHGFGSDIFYSYKINCSGIDTNAVVSHAGSFHDTTDTWNAIGCMKVSPNGSKLALVITSSPAPQLFDFNNVTGIVSNAISLSVPGSTNPYGVEFSPDNSKLYISTDVPLFCGTSIFIYQFDLSSGNPSSIRNSRKAIITVQTNNEVCFNYGSLQLGPDKKIYVAKASIDSLDVINYPDSLGSKCNYVYNGLYLGGRTSNFGLPNFIQSYYDADPSYFVYTNPCATEPTSFSADTTGIDSVRWEFGEPSSGILNISTQPRTSHLYQDPGTYQVKLILSYCGIIDTLSQAIDIFIPSPFTLGNDTTLCEGDTITLTPISDGSISSYAWSTGSANSFIKIDSSGTYALSIIDNNGCKNSDEINFSCEQLFIPNIFSPNEDGVNDLFKVKIEGYINFNMNIYNRWGEVVFKTSDIFTFWNGKIKNTNREAAEGNYYYVVSAVNSLGKSIKKSGVIFLSRSVW